MVQMTRGTLDCGMRVWLVPTRLTAEAALAIESHFLHWPQPAMGGKRWTSA